MTTLELLAFPGMMDESKLREMRRQSRRRMMAAAKVIAGDAKLAEARAKSNRKR